MKFKDVFYLPTGRIFLMETNSGYKIECTEMRDVFVGGKEHLEVRETQNPRVIWKHIVPYEEKWLLTVSTQKGCPHNCQFCDVAPLPFKGNLREEEILDQVRVLLNFTPYVRNSNKVKIGFARMGEPAYNLDNVLNAIKRLPQLSENIGSFNWLPCFNSILPMKTIEKRTAFNVIDHVINVKENFYHGHLHFQISCNSTDEEHRKSLFGSSVLDIESIVNYINKIKITDRTITLNFIVMDGVEVDVEKLKKMGLNSDKFAVKLIPLNKTQNAENHNLETYANYSNYNDLLKLQDEFKNAGIPVVMDAIARCEEAGLCCGQLVGANQ